MVVEKKRETMDEGQVVVFGVGVGRKGCLNTRKMKV